jgi:hypothetical protein
MPGGLVYPKTCTLLLPLNACTDESLRYTLDLTLIRHLTCCCPRQGAHAPDYDAHTSNATRFGLGRTQQHTRRTAKPTLIQLQMQQYGCGHPWLPWELCRRFGRSCQTSWLNLPLQQLCLTLDFGRHDAPGPH